MHPTSSDNTELSQRPTSQTQPHKLDLIASSSRTNLHLSHTSFHKVLNKNEGMSPNIFGVFSVPKNSFPENLTFDTNNLP